MGDDAALVGSEVGGGVSVGEVLITGDWVGITDDVGDLVGRAVLVSAGTAPRGAGRACRGSEPDAEAGHQIIRPAAAIMARATASRAPTTREPDRLRMLVLEVVLIVPSGRLPRGADTRTCRPRVSRNYRSARRTPQLDVPP